MPISVDGKLVHAVTGWIESLLVDRFSLAGLTELQADLLGAITVVGVIGNGGHAYWYEGADAEQTLRMAAAFDHLELPRIAEALRRSLTFFPGGAPPREVGERRRYISENREILERAFDPLDNLVCDSDFDGPAARHIVRHREELLAANPDLAAAFRDHQDASRRLVDGLSAACRLLDEPERATCAGLIATHALKAAFERMMSGGREHGAGFWKALAAAAHLLDEDQSSKRCWQWVRIGMEGALFVDARFTAAPGPDKEIRAHFNGDKLRWNAGDEPAGLFGAASAEILLPGLYSVSAGEPARLYLYPADGRARALAPGAPLVLHEKGEVVARAVVVEAREPRP
jgi:hypothetical protein